MKLKELLEQREVLAQKVSDLMAPVSVASEQLKEINDQITALVVDPIQAVRLSTGKDTGTVECLIQGVMVKSQTTKVVVWDQEKLVSLRERIAAHGDDPGEYMKTKIAYSIDEKKFKDFPPEVKQIFADARTVKASAPKLTFDLNWR